MEEGGIITFTFNITDIDGNGIVSYSYQWQIYNNTEWIDIDNETNVSYQIPSDQSLVDKFIRVKITTTDSLGGISNVFSNSEQVINVDDLATGTLTMTGFVQEGGTVSYSSTISDVDGTITFTYKWQVSNNNSDWENINNATNANYQIP